MNLRVLFLTVSSLMFTSAWAERNIAFASLSTPTGGSVAVAVTPDMPLSTEVAKLDEASGGAIARALAVRPLKAGEQRSLFGVGAWDELLLVANSERALRLQAEDFGGTAAAAFSGSASQTIHLIWDGPTAQAADVRFGATLGQYTFDQYQQAPEAPPSDATLTILVEDPQQAEAHWRGLRSPVASAVAFTRDLISEPANIIYPQSFADRTIEAFAAFDSVTVDVLDEKQIEALGMGALLGVGQGSSRPPRLVAVAYRGTDSDTPPVAFVGKGITFDTGGISLKSGSNVWQMKTDMSGAAAAVGVVLALAGREAPVNAVGIAALAENMPSGTAQRPGDVVRTGSGKTIEVLNTDAEGRLVLADGVWYAQEYFNPAVMIDLATLTGSVITALGDEYAGLFTANDDLADALLEAGSHSGEELWRLPMHASYAKDIQSKIADIKNISGHRKAGAGIGAQVIKTFVEDDQVWAHLDIAGTAWAETDEVKPTVPLGAAGWGVRLLDEWVRRSQESNQ